MKTIYIWIALMSAALQTGRAQSQDFPSSLQVSGLPQKGIGRLFVTPASGEVPNSLKELCDMSTLIVEGLVRTSLTPRRLSPQNLETDAIITVTRSLKGKASNPDIVISQRGGTIGQFTLKPAQYSIVQPGEQYLLFLKEDNRPDIPAISGAKRYFVTGVWSGLFYLNAGKIHVNADSPDGLRKGYEGLSEEEVINLVTDAISKPASSPPPFENVVTQP